MKKSKSTNRLSDLEQNLSSDRPLPPPPPDPSPSGSGGLFKLDKAHQKANQLSQAQQAPQQTHYKARSFDDNQPIEMVTEDRDNDSSMVARVFDTDEPITVQNQDYDQDYAEASSLNEMGTGEVPFQAASFEAEEDISPAREPDPRAFSHSSELGATLEEIRDEVQQLKWEQKQSPEQTEAIADQMAAISEELRSLRQQRIHQEGKLASDALQKGGTRDRHQGGGRHDRYQGGGKRDRSSQEVKPLSHDYWETLELEPTFDKFDRQMSEPEDSQYAPVDVVSPQAMEMDLSEQFDLFDRMMEVEERSERSASREFSEDLATGNGNYVEQFGLEEVNPTLNNYLKGKREHKENKNPYLNMYLDLDRDGKIERDTPANYNQWTPGKGKVGAIIMARPDRGVLNSMIMGKNEVKRGTPVEERYPLLFEWGGGGYKLDEHQGWTATLTVEPSDKIRVYLEDIDSKIQGNQEGATQILGTDSESKNQFVLHKNKEVYKSLEKHSAILMWMEATDYPDDDFDGLIRLTFEFSFKATKYTHKAILQVAPWIMASDLDPTYFVYAGRKHQDTELGVGDALEPIVTKAGVGFKLLKEQKKTFARDPMKAGYVLSPFYSGITILCDLDQGSPYRTLPASVYQNLVKEGIATQLIRKPKNIQETNDRFDGGGNYLVSPPSAKYPFGRIIYGAGTHVEKFIKAQNIQNPIEVNSGWLDVGHVDEFLSFIPNRKLLKSDTESPWPYKILIASPRLGYILSYIASAAKAVTNKEGSARNYGSRKMWEDANEIDRQIRQQVIQLKQDSSSSERTIIELMNSLLQKEFGDLLEPKTQRQNLKSLVTIKKGYQQDAYPTIDMVGRIVRINLPQKQAETEYSAYSIKSYLEKLKDSNIFGPQKFIDDAREILKRDLITWTDNDEEKESYFIDIPVLFSSTDSSLYFAYTPDSVNMLILNQTEKCHCIVPKPFGPVCGGGEGLYIFEQYIERKLTDLGLTVSVVNDWVDYYQSHGEIHCGTNQIPDLSSLKGKKWWE